MNWNFNNTYLNLPSSFYSFVNPTKVKNAKLILYNQNLAKDLDLDNLLENKQNTAEILAGNIVPKGAQTIAQAYCGHQFGHFNVLGDGRAILLGEQVNQKGFRFDVQLKGAGPTPYSRRGDGRATLSAMLREFVISEAMYALKIPTTRSLSVVHTGEQVYRENIQSGGILCRIASSHIRVGTFEFARQFLSIENQKELCTYTINRHFPELTVDKNPPLSLLKKVIELQVDLIVNWMRVGFIHGVMNTDNMSICGETIDYGPCAFMNAYRPHTVFSSIDTQGRYSFDNQAKIALWNLTRFAECLIPFVDSDKNTAIELLKAELDNFSTLYQDKWLNMMRKKIGIINPAKNDAILISQLLEWMLQNNADYTNTFVQLSDPNFSNEAIYQNQDFKNWLRDWKKTLQCGNDLPLENQNMMQQFNPAFIPRNHLVENALKSAIENKMEEIHELMKQLSSPYDYKNKRAHFQSPPINGDADYKTYCGT